MDRSRHKEEVTEEEFWKFVNEYPVKPVEDRAGRFVVIVETPHLVWHKPVAVRQGGRFYVVKFD